MIKLTRAEKETLRRWRRECRARLMEEPDPACREMYWSVLVSVLSRDEYWRHFPVYEPDTEGVKRWAKAHLAGGKTLVTWYGSMKGREEVNLGDNQQLEWLANLVDSSFSSAIPVLSPSQDHVEIREEDAFTVSTALWVEVDGARFLARLVVDIDDLGVETSSFSETARNVSLAATIIYNHIEKLGLDPTRHVVVYFSGSRGIHVEALLPAPAMWRLKCSRDTRLIETFASLVTAPIPNARTDPTQLSNMVARIPFTANVKTGLPKLPLDVDGTPMQKMPSVEPLPEWFADQILKTATQLGKPEQCRAREQPLATPVKRGGRQGQGTLSAWARLIEAIAEGRLPKLSDCRKRIAYSVGRWCRKTGLDQDQCLAVLEKIVEDAQRYARYMRYGWDQGKELHPPHPRKVFCEQAGWYSCPEQGETYCGAVSPTSRD